MFVTNPESEHEHEFFVDEDYYLTTDESKACAYAPQDIDKMIEHGESLGEVVNGVQAVFYAKDGTNIRTWFSVEDLDAAIREDNVLYGLI